MSESPPLVLCFGEILWDFLPDALYPGGAPFNVAYHLRQQGLDARPVSAVGRDVLGDELMRRLRAWKVDTRLIATHATAPTGYVQAAISERGDATYTIVRDVAWDEIPFGAELARAAVGARALVFGSLAQRSALNQRSLDELFAAVPAAALRVFDVNLRPPHDDLALVRRLARRATVIKLNAGEAARLARDDTEAPGREESDARSIAEMSGCSLVCITAGGRGAGLLRASQWHWENGHPITVADTIGAGDAFLASLVADLVSGHRTDEEFLAHACRLGEWVATQRGATPAYAPASR